MLLYDVYEEYFGIYKHVSANKKRPLSTVALHESEDNTLTSNLYEAINSFSESGIKDSFGLSFTEYLELPSDICIALTEAATRQSATKGKIINEIEQAMGPPKK